MYKLTELLSLTELNTLPCFTEELDKLSYNTDVDDTNLFTMHLYKGDVEVANDCYLNYDSKAQCLLMLIYNYLNDLQDEVK